MKKNYLLVIANSTQAKVYEVTGQTYVLTQELKHAKSHLKSQQLTTDKPGHYKTSHKSYGQFIPHSNPHEEEHIHFAKTVVDYLKKLQSKKHDQTIMLCAEPHFYGLLNQHLPKTMKNSIIKVIEKDYIPFPESKLNEVIKDIVHEHF